MRRRLLLRLLAAAAAARPLAGRAQQPERIRRVGVLIPLPESDPAAHPFVGTFTRALAGLGWVEGRNIRIDTRFGTGDPASLRSNAVELVGMSPDVILAAAPPAVAAMRQQTNTIPIVFVLVTDPVGQGFVQSLAHPGGNITGFGVADPPIMGKWLQLLKEITPTVTRVAVIFDPDTAPYAPLFNGALEAAAPSLGIGVTLAPSHDDAGIEDAIDALAHEPGGALVALPDAFPIAHRDVIIAAASRHRLPSIGLDFFPKAGGLMSYWSDVVSTFADAATYVDRILKGDKPADLPVQEPTKFSLIINLKTAKAIGLSVPQSLLQRADEVIE